MAMQLQQSCTRSVLLVGGLAAVVLLALSARGQELDKRVVDAEAARVAVVNKVKPAVVAIFSAGGQGGGSGVLISNDG